MLNLKNKVLTATLATVFLCGSLTMANAAQAAGVDSATQLTVSALLLTAFITAVVHTVTGPDHYLPFIAITGPDHYLPFIAIAKSRNYGLKKTLFWTFVCGIGHIVSALLIALLFVYFSHWLTETKFNWIENNRADLAAYAMIGLGGAYLLWAVWHRLRHKYGHEYHHELIESDNDKNISVWVLFIIFVLGPCEALLPILTASSVMGGAVVVSTTLLFSFATIATMMVMVTVGMLGIKAMHLQKLQPYAHELAGGTIMACGLAIVFGL